MKIFKIFVSLALSIVVEGNMLAAAVRGIEPIILSVGAAFAAFSGLDSQSNHGIIHFMDWDDFLKDRIPDVKPKKPKVS